MALSEININREVQIQTSAVIAHSNYEVLRAFILSRNAITPVIESISQLVSAHFHADKEFFTNKLTYEACQAQLNSDVQEANTSELEKERDNSLKISLNRDLLSLESKQGTQEAQFTLQQEKLSQMRSLNYELKANIRGIESALDQIRIDRASLNARYSLPLPMQGNVHAHTPQTIPVVIPNPVPGVIVYNPQDQLVFAHLNHEESRLKLEQERILALINLRDREYSTLSSDLDSISRTITQTKRDISTIKRQLDVTIPENERQRIIKQQNRTARDLARQNFAPAIQQLSNQNYQELLRNIDAKTKELMQHHDQLKTSADQLSYPEFLGQLENALSRQDGPQISYLEKEALKSILQMMNYYFTMEHTEAALKKDLDHAQGQLQQLKQKQSSNHTQVKRFTESNEQLNATNRRLEQENLDLAQRKKSAKTARGKALTVSGVTGVIGLLSAAVVGGLMLPPLFFLIPAAFALITLVALGTALTYHLIKSSAKKHINANVQSISDNVRTQESQRQQASKINSNTLPELEQQIIQAERVVVGAQQQLYSHQMAMDSHLKKMHNVTNLSGGTNSFFTTATGGDSPVPSAPPAYDLGLLMKYGT